METLTKEDFWNLMMTKYPERMKDFCAWIDEYKKTVGWDNLFQNGHLYGRDPEFRDIKFHNIPVAMQLGIFMIWTWKDFEKQYHTDDLTHARNTMIDYFVLSSFSQRFSSEVITLLDATARNSGTSQEHKPDTAGAFKVAMNMIKDLRTAQKEYNQDVDNAAKLTALLAQEKQMDEIITNLQPWLG